MAPIVYFALFRYSLASQILFKMVSKCLICIFCNFEYTMMLFRYMTIVLAIGHPRFCASYSMKTASAFVRPKGITFHSYNPFHRTNAISCVHPRYEFEADGILMLYPAS
jgi:hypothetical protein